MKKIIVLTVAVLSLVIGITKVKGDPPTNTVIKFKTLTPEEEKVIVFKGTEAPFSGQYNSFYEKGTYVCKRCGTALYRSSDKFNSHCGWPSFDDEIKGRVKRTTDADGRRTEITCAACDAHLGHVFLGEGFTAKNTRHCVNSISLDFIPDSTSKATSTDTAIFAAGCFWGVENEFEAQKGVVSAASGYTGGTVKKPTYKEVCNGNTGHAEAVKIVYNPSEISYESLLDLFFEVHNPMQRGSRNLENYQYRSAIFFNSENQHMAAKNKIAQIEREKGEIATQLNMATKFWPAEDYHQDYYTKRGIEPSCAIK